MWWFYYMPLSGLWLLESVCVSEQAHHRVFKVRKIKVEKRNAAVVYHCLLLQRVSPIHMCLGPNANHQMPLKYVSAFSRMCGIDPWKMGLERRQGQNYKPYQRAWPWCRPTVFFQFVVCWWLTSKLPGVLLIKSGFKWPAQDLRKTHFQGVRHF